MFYLFIMGFFSRFKTKQEEEEYQEEGGGNKGKIGEGNEPSTAKSSERAALGGHNEAATAKSSTSEPHSNVSLRPPHREVNRKTPFFARPSLHSPPIADDSVKKHKLLDVLFSLLEHPPPLPPRAAGYFEKVVTSLFRRRPTTLAQYINIGGPQLFNNFVKHLGNYR